MWGMIRGTVKASKVPTKNPRVRMNNNDGDRAKTTAIQTIYNGRARLFARVEIPARPGKHQFVIEPLNMDDDIAKDRRASCRNPSTARETSICNRAFKYG